MSYKYTRMWVGLYHLSQPGPSREWSGKAPGHVNQSGAADPAVPPGGGGWQQGVGPSVHFLTGCHTVGSCLTSGLQLRARCLPGNFVVTTEKMYLNLKQPDTGDSKEKASEKEVSTVHRGVWQG